MRIARSIPKATNTHTHSGCVILIPFPPQQRLHERALMLSYTTLPVSFKITHFPILQQIKTQRSLLHAISRHSNVYTHMLLLEGRAGED